MLQSTQLIRTFKQVCWSSTARKRIFICCLAWYLTLFWCEYLVFKKHIANCYVHDDAMENGEYENFFSNYNTTQIAIISDPQLTDPYSYSYAKRGTWILHLIQFYCDIYMRKSFKFLQLGHQDLDGVIFLGDLFDGAKILSDAEFKDEFKRWNWVFQKRVPNLVFYNVTGNHDIGYRVPDIQQQLVTRYIKHFGPIEYTVKVNGFTLIIISSVTLEPKYTPPSLYTSSIKFLSGVSRAAVHPAILLTHVPLWRPSKSECGTYNRYGPLVDRIGYSYTNMLNQNISNFLLEKIGPTYVLSGDNHDHCSYIHERGVPEHTMGTFSWMQGAPVPSYGLLHLHQHSDPARSFVTLDICWLPNQIKMYIWYGILFAITLVVLANPREWYSSLFSKTARARYQGLMHGGTYIGFQYLLRKSLEKVAVVLRRLSVVVGVVLPFYIFLILIHL